MDTLPVILSGGSGTRLWPLSRREHPKQLLEVLGDHTMLQATALRLGAIDGARPPYVVANAAQEGIIRRQMDDVGVTPAMMVLEPYGRNTAPALAAAARIATRTGADPVLLVLPADHVVADEAALAAAVATAATAATAGRLVVFGVTPTGPETGYGYIETGPEAGAGVSVVAAFVEKPDAATAAAYVAGGRHLWNSGMFVMRASVFLAELDQHEPEIVAGVDLALAAGEERGATATLAAAAFDAVPARSIDHAVMERTTNAVVVELDAGWSDVGSWSAVWARTARSADDTVLVGDVEAIDVTGCYIRSESRPVVAVGIRRAVVVETPDAVLVTHMHRDQDVKEAVARLERRGMPEATRPARLPTEWGTVELVADEADHHIRRISIDSGRVVRYGPAPAHHWVVAAGRGRLLAAAGDEPLAAGTAGTTDPGAETRIRAEGTEPLVLVEIGLGSSGDRPEIVPEETP